MLYARYFWFSRQPPYSLTNYRFIVAKGDKFSKKASLYLRNFIRLIDKSIAEYLKARDAILLQIEEKKRTAEEMREKGRFIYILSFVNHAENCINATRRLLYLLDGLKTERVSPPIPEIPGKLIKAHRDIITNVRGTVEHLDRIIQKDKHLEGEAIMLSISKDQKSMIISNHNLRFCDLASVIRNFYDIGKYLIEAYKT